MVLTAEFHLKEHDSRIAGHSGAQSRVRNLMYEKLAKVYNIWCVTCDLQHVVQQ
jgi:hypothetical protein